LVRSLPEELSFSEVLVSWPCISLTRIHTSVARATRRAPQRPGILWLSLVESCDELEFHVMSTTDRSGRSVLVAAAVIERDGRFLLGRRPLGKRHSELWEFPGGKLREGESIGGAIARELQEELGIKVGEVGPIIFRAADPESSFEICFVQVLAHGIPRALEHSELIWCDRQGILRLNLAPADKQFVLERWGGGDVGT